ncbi:MAG: hypothetical protein ACE5GE_11730 [Phycisphaerae bacterium]
MRPGHPNAGAAVVALSLWALPGGALLCPARQADGQTIAFAQVSRTAASPAGTVLGQSLLAGRYLVGTRLVIAELDNVTKTARVIAAEFACATDPAFDHDGRRLVFAGQRRSEDPLQIWEVLIPGLEPRQIVVCGADCVDPAYLGNGGVVFASLLPQEYEEHGGRFSLSLYASEPGTNAPHRITFNPSSDFAPTVLPDGRVLYSSWQHVGDRAWPFGVVALMLVNSDGTGVFPLTGNHRGPWLKRGGVVFNGDRVAFVQSEQFAEFGAGELVFTSLNDPFGPYAPLRTEQPYEVSDAASLPGGGLVLSARPAADKAATFGLYVYQAGQVRLLYDDPDYHELSPAVGGARARPELRISTVVPETPYGYLAILNCYDSNRGDVQGLSQGQVASVRVLAGSPRRHPEGWHPTSAPKRRGYVEPGDRDATSGGLATRILGEVPPAADGSVYLKVPADRPLRIQLVGGDGYSLINERAWFWVRPNERRVCIGCHEDRERAPVNRVPEATRQAPVDLTDPRGWETVSFRRAIQPMVGKNGAVPNGHESAPSSAGMILGTARGE